jgi:thiol-disulfide isomerase/thioredoxin
LLNPTITYPKLVYYNNGQPLEVHNNQPDKEALLTYIKRKLHPGVIKITNTYAFLDQLASDSKAFVLLSNDTTAVWALDELATTYKDYMFYAVEDETIVEKDYDNEIRMYSFGTEKAKSQISSDNPLGDIDTFIKKHTFKNYYIKFNEEVVNEVFMKQKTAIILFRNEYENKTVYLEQLLPMLAQQEKDLTWIVTDLSGKHELKLAKLMSVNFDTLPTLRILDFSTGFKRYELNSALNADSVLEFIRLFKKGELSPYYSSQREDVNNKKAIVRKLTSGTFYENVIILKKNVLVLFHTSWCGHCKKVKLYIKFRLYLC